ncbi:MAG: AAA family ATPase [Pseudonocardiaceae bacterium]
MADDAVLTELLAAVDASPDVVPLRLRVAELLTDRGRYTEALAHCTAALQHDPGNAEAVTVRADNEGVFVLGATNHPWDVDSALRRPGRFDRMLLVLPPDPPARTAILHYHLRGRPLSGIDIDALVRTTVDFSGADLGHLCESATERALAASIATGSVRPVTMADLSAALREVRPSTGPWFAIARNVATFANSDGSYDDLVRYLRTRKKR